MQVLITSRGDTHLQHWPLLFDSHQEKENVEFKNTTNQQKTANGKKEQKLEQTE